jgi:hypothetical protein
MLNTSLLDMVRGGRAFGSLAVSLCQAAAVFGGRMTM